MLGSHSLTEAMQQRISDYSLEIRSVLQMMPHPVIFFLAADLMFRLCDLAPQITQEHQAAAGQRAGERPDSSEEYAQSVEGYQGLKKLPELHQHPL